MSLPVISIRSCGSFPRLSMGDLVTYSCHSRSRKLRQLMRVLGGKGLELRLPSTIGNANPQHSTIESDCLCSFRHYRAADKRPGEQDGFFGCSAFEHASGERLQILTS
jgi:hypothetical protein